MLRGTFKDGDAIRLDAEPGKEGLTFEKVGSRKKSRSSEAEDGEEAHVETAP
jgi:hypothetical protein